MLYKIFLADLPQYLPWEIQRTSFEEMRNTEPKINKTLHDLCKDLVSYVISGLSKTTTIARTRSGHCRVTLVKV